MDDHRLAPSPACAAPAAAGIDGDLPGPTLDVLNPFDGALLRSVPTQSAQDVRRAIDTACGYDFRLSAWERYEILQRLCALLLDDAEEIARTISLESGKTLADARVEVERAHQAFLLSSEEAKRIDGEVVPTDAVAGLPTAWAMVVREPIGLVAAITPFNYPLNLVAHKVGPAIAANNPVIVKPASATPLSALGLRRLLLEAGLPPEMMQVLVGEAEAVGDALASDERVRKVSFTGSVSVGKHICRRAGMKAICMELGGNDPMIILDDADLDRALPIAIDGAFGNNGERCTSVKRLIVDDAIADVFIERFVEAAGRLRVGDQTRPETDVGPLIDVESARTIERRVNASVAAGATLLLGGRREGALYWPTVLDRVTMDSPVVADETFGPVAPVLRVSGLDEAIEVANDTPFGLQSGVFTRSLARAKEAAARIEAGAVMINRAPGFRAEHLPFGGIKDSGIGREGIRYAVESMTRLKTILM